MLIRGVEIGVVVKRTKSRGHIGNKPLGSGPVWERPWHDFARENSTDSGYIHTNEPVDLMFHKTCIWDHIPGECHQNRHRMEVMRYVRQITQSEWERVHRGVWTPFVQKDFTNSTVFSETVQKRMVITNIGYLGSARMNLYVGNQEWICMCNDLPFIVHNIDTEVGGPERALYNLQSECYVHGIVDSEFFIEAARKGRLDVPPETFDRGSYEPLHTMTARATSVPYVKMKRYV